jgi:sialate O-acetylesterase
MWEAGVASVLPYPIRGVAWYQGESNAESPERVAQHEAIFEMLVRDWRAQWGLGDFPFLFVQLPGLGRPDWPEFREQQRGFLESLPEMGMAVTIDVGHPTNVHPKGKRPVGERLARWALGKVYEIGSEASSGPLFDSVTADGDGLLLSFEGVGRGLISKDGEALRHFEVAGEDGVFHRAEAEIMENRVRVRSDRVPTPKRVRYAWAPYPEPPVNFFGREGLPASPFAGLVARP